MLLELRVENYAVIDRAGASFGAGLNLLTGETGAGKSILIDALALLLGGRSTPDFVRHGAEKAVVSCVFESTPGAEAVLEANGIDTEPDSDVELLYEKACGYKPAQGGEGPGGNEQKVLTYILREGAPAGKSGTQVKKIDAFVEVAVTNLDNVKRTIADCGVCYIGFDVPQYIMPPGKPPLAVWDVDPQGDNTIVGGHAVVLAGYDAQGARVISWGQYYTMTWAFFERFVDEAYAIADPEWITAKGTTPGGLTIEQLEAAMKALKS